MASDQVKILSAWPSPFVARTMIALNLKSVKYELVEENLMSKSDLLLKSNPIYKKIPVLIHGGRPICESIVILEYIDEVWASRPSILPHDPYDRAIARFLSAYVDDKLAPGLKAILMAEGQDAKKAAAVEEVSQLLALLEGAFRNCSKGQRFFGGDKIGYLDISLGSLLAWIRVVKKISNVSLIDESKTPNLFKWAQDFAADVAVKDVLPETDKLMEFAKIFVAKYKAPRRH